MIMDDMDVRTRESLQWILAHTRKLRGEERVVTEKAELIGETILDHRQALTDRQSAQVRLEEALEELKDEIAQLGVPF